jgi:GDP/UDP-N,N'-diacetylbacillosamine 2-epimerase (hydrolysing)
MRKIIYITGTRADYGLMRTTLFAISHDPQLDLHLIVTGMHMDEAHGKTQNEIESDGFKIAGYVETDLSGADRSFMARAIGTMIIGFSDLLEREQPDFVLLLGDRGEMLAGAIAALHLNIPVVHIHGGERSGTVDDPVRHAISKMSHYHFTATQDAATRLIKMGERGDRVFCVGAPGLDGLKDQAQSSRAECLKTADFSENRPVALMVFHPVVQEIDDGPRQVREIIDALLNLDFQIVLLTPNADLGGNEILQALTATSGHADIRIFNHLQRQEFLSWLSNADVMIGNSSSGIIEAATFGTPVINIGKRQMLRQRNANVMDVEPDGAAIGAALIDVLKHGRFVGTNVYGDGATAPRITKLLTSISLDQSVLEKHCVY